MFTLVTTVQSCVILAQSVGQDPQTGEEIPSFFAAFMITKEGKPAVSFDSAECFQRISHNRNTYQDLVGFCHGYIAAAAERGGVRPDAWRFQGTLYPKDIAKPSDQEKRRLLAWPNDVEN